MWSDLRRWSMRSFREMAIGLLVVVAAMLTSVALVVRALPSKHQRITVATAPFSSVHVVAGAGSPAGSFTVPVTALPAEAGFVGTRIAIGGARPSATLRLSLRDGGGVLVASCSIPPTAYGDASDVGCRVPDASVVRRLTIAASGAKDAIGVWVQSDAGKDVTGSLSVARDRESLSARLRELADRFAASRGGRWPIWIGLGALVLGLAATYLALSILCRQAGRSLFSWWSAR